jgi:hypothetical protein
MERQYKKCCNPDCIRLTKRHNRCGVCRKFCRYFCRDCKVSLDNDKKELCPECVKYRHREWQRLHGKQYNKEYHLKHKSVTDLSARNNNILLQV